MWLGLNPLPSVKCVELAVVSLILVCFSPGSPVFFLVQKPTLLNIIVTVILAGNNGQRASLLNHVQEEIPI